MTRRRRKSAPPATRRPPGETRRPVGGPPGPNRARALGSGLLALAVVLTVLWGVFGRRGTTPAEPEARLDPDVAYERGLALGAAGRFIESLPYFRRAAAAPGGTTWQVRHDYSSALHNATLESRTVGRFGLRVSRSSVERVAMLRESLRQLDLAAAQASAPRERAFLEAMRASTLATWGFPLDALEAYRRARALDPSFSDSDEAPGGAGP